MTSRLRPILATLLAGILAGACGSVSPATPSIAATAIEPSLQASGLASAQPTPQPSSGCATATFDAMTEQERIGQLFMLGIDGGSLSPADVSAIVTDHLGSVFVVNRRTDGVDGVGQLTRAIQALAPGSAAGRVGMFVAADQEGGLVQRLNGPGFSTIPPATQQGQLSAATLEQSATNWGKELKTAGVNVNLAPVMDVVPPGTDAINKPIGALNREFGHDPATVGDHGAAVVRGMQAAGVASTLKHFPGLGRVAGNTDTSAGVVDSAMTADDPYLAAFRAGIQAGAPMAMVSLATYTAIDPDHQAVFSTKIIEGLLRGDLGFDGVVVSDDLGAATSVAAIPVGDRAVRFLSAGGELVLVEGTDSAIEMEAAVSARAASEPSFEAVANAASLRIIEANSAYGLLTCR
jgi:beta-N-acetylhexosaminidase